ncbi:uncharacterized protein LOC130685235 [Daphnia carinata]|uniref:uncharacterized protein LOC130685235 n=1 Tax=Daphnia carinata TaxID=120202 RepID=UPI0025799B52|nr:uncharacterized protein LOC130685235 [Daphnia carinata]
MASSLLLKVCVFSALTCVSRITFTCASFTSSTSSLQSMDFGTNATKGLLSEGGDGKGILLRNSTSETNTTNNADRKPHRRIIDPLPQTRKRSMKSLVSPEFTMDKFIMFMTASSNLMNSNTKYPRLDKLMKSFSRLYNSDGMTAVNNFWNMWVNVWTVIDAVANIFRAYETRILNTIDENQPQPPNPLEDLQQSLDDASNNIAVVSDLFQQLARMGEFEDGSAEQQGDDRELNVMQTVKQRLLHDAPQDKQDNGDEGQGTDEDHKDYGKEEKIHSLRQRINSRHAKAQRLADEKIRHFYYPAGYSSNSGDNQEGRRTPADASDFSNPVTRTRRTKQFAVDTKYLKRKFKLKSLISESNFEAISKRSINIVSDRTKKHVKRSANRRKRSNLRFNFGVDKFIYFMAKANNVLNSNTNNVQLNRFTRAFNDLFDSDGLNAFNTFYTLLASFWTIVDAVANVFRFNEARIRDQIQQQQAEAQPDPLGDLQAELDDTNTNLSEVADLVSALQNGAAARVESANAKSDNAVGPHHVQHEKKDHSKPSHEGDNHRVHANPSAQQANPSYQGSYKSHPTKTPESVTFSPITTKSYGHFASDSWIPITESSQPSIETNRNFYFPVSYGTTNNQFSSRQHNAQSFSMMNHQYNPVVTGTSSSDIKHRVNHQYSGSASRQPIDNSANATPRGSSNRQSSYETRRHVNIESNYHTHSTRTGRRTNVSQGYGETSAIAQSSNN